MKVNIRDIPTVCICDQQKEDISQDVAVVELDSCHSDGNEKERDSSKLQSMLEIQWRSQNRQLSRGKIDLKVWWHVWHLLVWKIWPWF